MSLGATIHKEGIMRKITFNLMVVFILFATALSGFGMPNAQAMDKTNPLMTSIVRPVPAGEPYTLDAWSTEKCITFWKVKFCVGAKWENLKLRVGVGILGKWKWWTAVNVQCYEYKVTPASAKVCVRNYSWKKPKLAFTLILSGCVDVVLKKYCGELYRKSFSVTIP